MPYDEYGEFYSMDEYYGGDFGSWGDYGYQDPGGGYGNDPNAGTGYDPTDGFGYYDPTFSVDVYGTIDQLGGAPADLLYPPYDSAADYVDPFAAFDRAMQDVLPGLSLDSDLLTADLPSTGGEGVGTPWYEKLWNTLGVGNVASSGLPARSSPPPQNTLPRNPLQAGALAGLAGGSGLLLLVVVLVVVLAVKGR